MRERLIPTILSLFLTAGYAIAAQAEGAGKNLSLLLKQQQIFAACAQHKLTPVAENACLLRVSGANAERGIRSVSGIAMARSPAYQTLSGVLFKESFGSKIHSVRDNRSSWTTIDLPGGEYCAVWSVDAYVTPSPIEFSGVVESAVRTVFDTNTPLELARSALLSPEGKQALRFEGGGFRAQYLRDEKAAAAVWAVCRGPEGPPLSVAANNFFRQSSALLIFIE